MHDITDHFPKLICVNPIRKMMQQIFLFVINWFCVV